MEKVQHKGCLESVLNTLSGVETMEIFQREAERSYTLNLVRLAHMIRMHPLLKMGNAQSIFPNVSIDLLASCLTEAASERCSC